MNHNSGNLRKRTRTRGQRLVFGAGCLALLAGAGGMLASAPAAAPPDRYVVFGYNELGMHCMQQDFSEMMILPPFNSLRATVIDRSGEEPRIVRSGVTVEYSLPTNTHSSDKCNFWSFAQPLLGVQLEPDIGLAGKGLSGSMAYSGRNDFVATGIPVTPVDDFGREDPYPLSHVTVTRNGIIQGQTQAVVPVSWEMSCNICHNTPGVSVATDILRAHDRLHGTTLEAQKPVFCASCHADPAVGAPGTPGVPNLSSAMHTAHAPRMAIANLDNECYACHPGFRTQCQRDVHSARGMTCNDCHTSMTAVGDPARRPWVDLPTCASCHTRAGFQFEEPGHLYRDSLGHRGVACMACHGSPHAITPTLTAVDNLQAIGKQGHPGVINQCTVCHQQTPDDPFPHRPDDD